MDNTNKKYSNEILKKVHKYPGNLEIFIGQKQAIQIRIDGWEETKKENLILVAPEATLNLPLPKSVKKRGRAVVQKKIITRFIENINSLESLDKNIKRLEQGIEVKYFDHHGFSLSVRDEAVVVIEFPFPIDNLINFKISDPEFAKNMKKYYQKMWKKATPLTPKLIKSLKLKWT